MGVPVDRQSGTLLGFQCSVLAVDWSGMVVDYEI